MVSEAESKASVFLQCQLVLLQNGAVRASPRRFESTQARLFGGGDDRPPASPRRVNATFAPSSIFADDDVPKSPARTPKKIIPIMGKLRNIFYFHKK